MLKSYRKSVAYYINDKLIDYGYSSWYCIEDEENAKDVKCSVSFDDVKDGGMSFWYQTLRNKRYVKAIDDCNKCHKIYINSDTIFTKVITYREMNLSMQELFKIPDGDKVIEFFKQRGLTICPMGK